MKKAIQSKVKLFIMSLIIFPLTNLNAQVSHEWVSQYSGTDDERGYGITSDGSGNVISIGYFRGTVDFDPGAGTTELTSTTLKDIYVTKVDTDGDLVWAIQFAGEFNDHGYGITVDASDNIYITGAFTDTVDFDPGAGTSYLYSRGNADVFIVKLDASGNLVWAKSVGGEATDVGLGIDLDANNSVYVTGYFNETAYFDTDTTAPGEPLITAGQSDAFVLKLNSSGSDIYNVQFGGTGQDWGYSIAIDDNNNAYTTGYFEGTADFDPDTASAATFNLTSTGGKDSYVCKILANSTLDWAVQFGSTGDERGISIDLDGDNNVYTAGFFSSTADFDPSGSTANITSNGNFDMYISKLSSTGTYLWAHGFGSTEADIAMSMDIDVTGYLYFTGYYRGTVDFDPSAGTTELTSAGDQDVFISKYSPDGNFEFARGMGGAGRDIARDITVDDNGQIYLTGFFSGTSNYNHDGGTDILTSLGSNDIFAHKSSHILQTNLESVSCGASLSSITDPFFTIAVPNATNYEYEFTNTSTLEVINYTRGTSSNSATLSLANIYDVGVTFDVRVRAQVGGVWGEYGETCQLTSPSTVPTTKIRDADCGLELEDFETLFFADQVQGATNYEFEFVNTITEDTTEVMTNSVSRNMSLDKANLLTEGVEYTVRVRAQIGDVWGEYDLECSITAPGVYSDPTITQIRDVDCGLQTTTIFDVFFCDEVVDATNYEYEFANTTTDDTTYYERGSSSTVVSLNLARLYDVQVTYSVRVRAFIDGTWQEFGEACEIHAPENVSDTKLRDADCGKTVAAFTTAFYADQVKGATNYEYEFTNVSTLTQTIVQSGSQSRAMRLSTAGLFDTDATYDVRVRAEVTGVWGTFNTICQITSPSSSKFGVSVLGEELNGAYAYPNPSSGNHVIIAFESSSEGTSDLEILNINGQLVYTTSVNYTSGMNKVNVEFVDKLSGGVYFARIGETVIRFIVQ